MPIVVAENFSLYLLISGPGFLFCHHSYSCCQCRKGEADAGGIEPQVFFSVLCHRGMTVF